MENLSTYPSDTEIQECLDVTFQKASVLLNLLGIKNSTSGSIKDLGMQLADAAHKVATALRLEESDPTLVDKVLVADNVDNLAESQPNEVDQKMTNLGIAAMAIVIHNTICMYIDNLPEDGDAECQEWRQSIQALAKVLMKEILQRNQSNMSHC
ncbi:hypothetical protein PILCRDRAFT_5297 [Piloderma croceum F 1598]|uniref:Uncharacterized protein n=1 Tax=Piloderma croceum (strain F 1598) TaxID=765440 RepID=A0A0C3FP51_PILCF|nr:hypothetical protein PILCRDRAFT_5297 [Piloderma croceum F 1598]